MINIRIYTKQACTYCAQAKQLLKGKGLAYEEIELGSDPLTEADLVAFTGYRTVPQIFINENFIGGYTELAQLNGNGELDRVARFLSMKR